MLDDTTCLRAVRKILMRRDGLSESEAADIIDEAIARVRAGEDPEEVCHEEFGLEPDYAIDLALVALR